MAIKDVLLQLNSYPTATPDAVVEQAVDFAATCGAHLTALAFKIEIPSAGNPLASSLLNLSGMVAAERQKSVANTEKLITAFAAAATKRGLPHEHIVETCTTSEVAGIVTEHARLHDITLIPIGAELGLQQYIAENVVFGSGRPTIILPESHGALSADVIGVAWDFSRPAARAIADAMPILQRAKSIRVVTVTQEKTIETKRSGVELSQHFARHGIEIILDEEQAGGRSIGQVFDEYVARHRIDLLVMGAYGHSRLRNFILGGATKSVISHPKLPVLLSH